MKHLIAAVLLLFSCSNVWALDCGAMKMPPLRYVHDLPYNPVIHFKDYWQMDSFCQSINVQRDGAGRVVACNRGHDMYLSTLGSGGITLEEQECQFFHEEAHMFPNLWPADHPNAIFWRNKKE